MTILPNILASALLDGETPKEFFKRRGTSNALPPGYRLLEHAGITSVWTADNAGQFVANIEPRDEQWAYYRHTMTDPHSRCFKGIAATKSAAIRSAITAFEEWRETHSVKESETPKEFFKRRGSGGPTLPKIEDVDFELECEAEVDGPEGNFASGDDEEDAAHVARMRQELENGNLWAWCYVKVTATWTDKDHVEHTGYDSMSGCNYWSRANFVQPGGTYDDMKQVAYDDLIYNIEHYREIQKR